MRLSVVIPCYNEERNIPVILKKFQEVISDRDIEVVLVNNGSTDNTAHVLKDMLPDYNFARSILVPENRGYGYGIIQGLKACTGDFMGWTHADMQTDPKDIIEAYRILEENQWDKRLYIKGNRKGRPIFDTVFTVGMSLLETFYLKKFLYDINAQPNVFSKEFFYSWISPPDDFSLEVYSYYLAKKNGSKIIRMPVMFSKRLYGKSSWNTGLKEKWKYAKRTISFTKSLKKRGIK